MQQSISRPQFILFISHMLLIACTAAGIPRAAKNESIAHLLRVQKANRIGLRKKFYSRDIGNTESWFWGGAVQSPLSGTFNQVSASWAVPSISATQSGNGQGTTYTWFVAVSVGLDVADVAPCNGAFFQAGTYTTLMSSESWKPPSTSIWYEWYPADIVFTNIELAAGEVVEVWVTANSVAEVTVSVTNQGGEQVYSTDVSAPGATSTLCATNAVWMVESSEDSTGSCVPNFSDFSFNNCLAETTNQDSVDIRDAKLYNLVSPSTFDEMATVQRVSNSELAVHGVLSGGGC